MSYSLYTIASENNFLRVLAQWLLREIEHLSRATILVPNRRSARALEDILLSESELGAMLLPLIRPIGDIDEELVADNLPEDGVPNAIAKSAHLYAILNLIMQWAKANAQSELAQDVLASGAQAFSLAQSLQELINQFETEDVEIEKLQDAYDLDLAGHRQNILDLLHLITNQLPKLLQTQDLVGPSARRNQMIRLEAARIAAGKHKGPIIAAGSTGTNPATRDLLQAIALDARGTVVLPGLDQKLDLEGWNAVNPEHPQYSLKAMLEQWGVDRADVKVMGLPQAQRMWLMGQTLRPADVAERWNEILPGEQQQVKAGLHGVEFVETADRQQEAEVIALALRQHVENSTAKAALMTPDRDLATRVKSALQRWNLDIDDSAGEQLLHGGRAALLLLLLQTIEEGFKATSLFALLYHRQCNFGHGHADHVGRVRSLELIAYRGLPEVEGIGKLVQRIVAQKQALQKNIHAHPLVKNLTEDQWVKATGFAAELSAVLLPLADRRERSLHDHIANLKQALDSISPLSEEILPADQLFLDVMVSLQDASPWHPVTTLSKAQHSILHALSQETLRPPFNPERQLAIYGLAEARLVDAEFLIMGGLTEGSWPARPESGPWLNRPMRAVLNLQQPERDIGVTAHDFAQGFGHERVMLTWPKRLNGAPAIPSRWVLRMQAVIKASGMQSEQRQADHLIAVQKLLDTPETFAPHRQPRPSPPVNSRPTTFSVSRVEKLIRDSYHVYAERILKLRPVEPIGQDVDARLRGTLIHAALQQWSTAIAHAPASEYLHVLLLKGAEAFAPFIDMPEVQRFWWPRFERMARDFIEHDSKLRPHILNNLTEIDGWYECDINGVLHRLTARADRIDILQNGNLRIIDYKSGGVPSAKQVSAGLSPQLSLEGMIATKGKFKGVNSNVLEDVIFMTVGGGREGLKTLSLSRENNSHEEIENAEVGLRKLFSDYQNPQAVYLPRHNLMKTDDVSDYDHLSRRLEWELESAGK